MLSLSIRDTMSKIKRPPAVDGVSTAGASDVGRILWWAQRGFWHGAAHGSVTGRVVSAVCAVMWWPMWPLLWVVQARVIARRATRYYLSPDRDATLSVVAKRGKWIIGDHLSARPGAGCGRALRAVLLPSLCAVADAEGIVVVATAANARLAEVYRGDVPGLEVVGRGFPRGVRLRRAPR